MLPHHWVAERSFAWAARLRRLAQDFERRTQTPAGLHCVVFVCLKLSKPSLQLPQVHNVLQGASGLTGMSIPANLACPCAQP